MRYVGTDWIKLAADRESLFAIGNMMIKFRVLLNVGNFFTNLETVRFSRRTSLHGVSI